MPSKWFDKILLFHDRDLLIDQKLKKSVKIVLLDGIHDENNPFSFKAEHVFTYRFYISYVIQYNLYLYFIVFYQCGKLNRKIGLRYVNYVSTYLFAFILRMLYCLFLTAYHTKRADTRKSKFCSRGHFGRKVI